MLIEQGRHAEALRALDQGADPNAADGMGRTALMYAGINGQTDTMEALIRRGARIDARDRSGATPLHAAIMFGDPRAVRLLLAQGADLRARWVLGAGDGVTPLALARLRQRQAPEKPFLDLRVRDGLLVEAVKSDYEQIVRLLQGAGATE
ncbi:MAG TPA: ankyrin repeat domain-containing protein [Albitalea sp.]